MWNSVFGYVIIRLDGMGIERFLNRILKAGIPVWNVYRLECGSVNAEMRAKDFLKLRELKRGLSCRIHIVKRHGLPFLYAKYRFRKLLIFGAAVSFTLVVVFQARIWLFRVEGISQVPEAVIMRAIASEGVRAGAARTGIETAALGQAIRTYDRRIAWAGVKLDGIIMRIKVVEAEPIPLQQDKSAPVNVVAKKDGIIERITALSGKANVKQGDAVRAGDVLINGDITREGALERLMVHAEGDVSAQVWYRAVLNLPPTQKQLARSGKYQPFRAILIAGCPVYKTPVAYASHELEFQNGAIVRGLVLPLCLIKGSCYELTLQDIEREPDELLAEALFYAELDAIERVPKEASVLKKVSETEIFETGAVSAAVTICTLEDIGLTKAIDYTTED